MYVYMHIVSIYALVHMCKRIIMCTTKGISRLLIAEIKARAPRVVE